MTPDELLREASDPTTPTERLAEIQGLLLAPWKMGPTGWQGIHARAPELFMALRRNPSTPRSFLFDTVVGYPEVVLANPIVSLYLLEGLTEQEQVKVRRGLARLLADNLYADELALFLDQWARANRCVGKTKRIQALIERDSRESEDAVLAFVAQQKFKSESLGALAAALLVVNEWRKGQPDSVRGGKPWHPFPALDVIAAIAGQAASR